MDSMIDVALREELTNAGMIPAAVVLGVAALKRDESALATLGVRQAVAAFKAANATLFSTSYRDMTKSVEQIERERDREMQKRYGWTH